MILNYTFLNIINSCLVTEVLGIWVEESLLAKEITRSSLAGVCIFSSKCNLDPQGSDVTFESSQLRILVA